MTMCAQTAPAAHTDDSAEALPPSTTSGAVVTRLGKAAAVDEDDEAPCACPWEWEWEWAPDPLSRSLPFSRSASAALALSRAPLRPHRSTRPLEVMPTW